MSDREMTGVLVGVAHGRLDLTLTGRGDVPSARRSLSKREVLDLAALIAQRANTMEGERA